MVRGSVASTLEIIRECKILCKNLFVQFGLLSQLMFLEIRQIFFTALKSDLRDSRHAAADAIIIPNTAGNISTTVYMTYMLFYCHINGKTKAPLND